MLQARTRVPTTLRRRVPGGGFSLVEVLVAITLVGIAAALAIPRASRIMSQTRIQRATQALQLEVQQAFAISARNRAPVQVRWDAGTMQLRLTNLAGSTVFRRLSIGDGGGYGLSASEVTVAPTTLTIFPNGLASDTLSMTLSRNGYSRRLW